MVINITDIIFIPTMYVLQNLEAVSFEGLQLFYFAFGHQ